ncbi:HPP family protein [Chitinibacteraceae bacterium HSL-7]
MKQLFSRMQAKGQCPPRKPLGKIAWSWLGSFIAMVAIAKLGPLANLDGEPLLFLIGSFGASAVLVYGAPLAEFSQPRNLVGGHVISALIGVAVWLMLGRHPVLAAALAVSLAIVAMHLSRTLHPPGGATALIAVIGGEQVHHLGFQYVLSPVLTGALLMLLIALVVNNLSANPRRHYPVYWA